MVWVFRMSFHNNLQPIVAHDSYPNIPGIPASNARAQSSGVRIALDPDYCKRLSGHVYTQLTPGHPLAFFDAECACHKSISSPTHAPIDHLNQKQSSPGNMLFTLMVIFFSNQRPSNAGNVSRNNVALQVQQRLYICQLFLNQRRETFILRSVRISEDDPTISEDFRKLPKTLRRIPIKSFEI